MTNIKTKFSKAVFFLFCLFLPCGVWAEGVTAIYLENEYPELSRFEKLLSTPEGLPVMLSFINDTISLDKPLTVLVGADDGPLYDPETEEIFLPLTFLQDIETRFASAFDEMEQSDLDNAVLDVVMHTLYHELGHALISQYNLAVLAREEDAVDSLANMLLLEYIEDGDIVAYNAADMFGFEDQDVEEFDHQDFWDEHSLDIQRYYSTLCHIYGSDPDKHEHLVSEDVLSEERADSCIHDYTSMRDSWNGVLADYLK